MALTRGVGSLFPCPRCVVAKKDLWDPSISSVPRTPVTMRAVITAARAQKLKADKEKKLKDVGLRDIEVFIIWD